jgi:hypothetical protein
MLIQELNDCEEIIAGDGTLLRINMLVVIMKQPIMQWLVQLNWGSSSYGVL